MAKTPPSNESENALAGIEMKMKAYGADLGCPTTNEEHICTGSVLNDADVIVTEIVNGQVSKYELKKGEMVLK